MKNNLISEVLYLDIDRHHLHTKVTWSNRRQIQPNVS